MLTHPQLWRAIDAIAARRNVSLSTLAQSAHLDRTVLDPSKRVSRNGHERWPSTETLWKLLAGADVTLSEFGELLGDTPASRSVPLLGLAQAGERGFFDDAGYPIGEGWDALEVPGVDGVYALEVTDASLLPVYRQGERLLIEPVAEPRRGDRVVVSRRDGVVTAGEAISVSVTRLAVQPLDPHQASMTLKRAEITRVGRIVWVSQ